MITEILKLMPRLKKKKNLSSSLFGKGCLLKSSQKARKEMLMTKVMGLDGLLKSPRQTRWTQFVMTKRTMLITITRRVGLGGPLKRMILITMPGDFELTSWLTEERVSNGLLVH